MAESYRSLDQKPYDSFHVYVEATFDYPVEKVWAQALNIGNWMSAHRLETIDGEPGRVGHFERVHPRNLASDTPLPHHHLYGIAHLVPLKAIILEVFPENGGSYGKTRAKMSFDSILFTDMGNQTRVVFHMVDVHPERSDDEFRTRRQGELAAVYTKLPEFFENLRRLVESADGPVQRAGLTGQNAEALQIASRQR